LNRPNFVTRSPVQECRQSVFAFPCCGVWRPFFFQDNYLVGSTLELHGPPALIQFYPWVPVITGTMPSLL
jgi:hypothetical protein